MDLFAGPGGAGWGITQLELTELGFEIDDAACQTRRAAGLDTVECDLTKVDPLIYWGVQGLWASPPCQGFSRAGLMKGHGDAGRIMEHIAICSRAGTWVEFADDGMEWADDKSQLVLQPLRWALLAEPQWMVWEQVPFVLTIWEACAEVLEDHGYHVWVGKMHSEQYGVPQSRERAILIASKDGPVKRPTPTHSKYYPRDSKKLDEGVKSWVTMAQALGWGMSGRPYFTVMGGTGAGGADHAMVGGSGARAALNAQREGEQWVVQRSNYSHGSDGDTADERGRGVRLLDEPSMALTGRPPQWLTIDDENDPDPTVQRAVSRRELVSPQSIAGGPRARRGEDQPSVTVTTNFSRAKWDDELVVSTGNNSSTIGPGAERDAASWRDTSVPYERSIDLPAPTLDTKVGNAWRVHAPGGRVVEVKLRNNTSDNAAERGGDQPAPTMYFGERLNSMHWVLRMTTMPNSAVRSMHEPAPTIAFGNDSASAKWFHAQPVGMLAAGLTAPTTSGQRERDLDEPSATITGKGTAYWVFGENELAVWHDEDPLLPTWSGGVEFQRVENVARIWEDREVNGLPGLRGNRVENIDWPIERPSTVVTGRAMVQHPGQTAGSRSGVKNASTKSRNDGIRVTVQEAGILQSFPADYPWQGSRTKQFECVGNAVPPLLASHAVLEAAGPTRGTGWVERSKANMVARRSRSTATPLTLGFVGSGQLDKKAIIALLDDLADGVEVDAIYVPVTKDDFTDEIEAVVEWAIDRKVEYFTFSDEAAVKKDKVLKAAVDNAKDDFDFKGDAGKQVVEMLADEDVKDGRLLFFFDGEQDVDLDLFEAAADADVACFDLKDGGSPLTFDEGDDTGVPEPEEEPEAPARRGRGRAAAEEEPEEKPARSRRAAKEEPADEDDDLTTAEKKRLAELTKRDSALTELKKTIKALDKSIVTADLVGKSKEEVALLIIAAEREQDGDEGAEEAPAARGRGRRAAGGDAEAQEAPEGGVGGDKEADSREEVFARLRGNREAAERIATGLAKAMKTIVDEADESQVLEHAAAALAAGMMVFAEVLIAEVRKPKSAGRPRADGTEAQPKPPVDPDAPRRGRGRPRKDS